MVDAGFSCRQIELRLATLGLQGGDLDGLVLTHEHGDHVRGAPLLSRRHELPVWGTAGTLGEIDLGRRTAPVERLVSGQPTEVAGFVVEPFLVPHDAREPIGVVVEDEHGRRVGLAADLGTPSRLAWGRLADLDVLVLETNHDLEMLRGGPYPWPLKERVAGRHGHLSNRQAAEGLRELLCDRLRTVVAYHLSRTNNTALLAAEAVGGELDRAGSTARVVVTRQDEPTGWIDHDAVSVAEEGPTGSSGRILEAIESATREVEECRLR
jgi:phosphoribosyl 1,2-cyclic phosphodiesterase